MIRINLSQNVKATSSGAETIMAEGITYGEVQEQSKSTVLLKLLVIFIVPFGLAYYGGEELRKRERDLKRKQNELAQIESRLQQIGAAAREVQRFKEEKISLENRVRIIADLSKTRLEEVIALDNLQSLVPNGTWLSDLIVDNNKMTLKGFAVSESDVTKFIQALEDSVFFTNVVFTSAVKVNTAQGVAQKFDISCDLESI